MSCDYIKPIQFLNFKRRSLSSYVAEGEIYFYEINIKKDSYCRLRIFQDGLRIEQTPYEFYGLERAIDEAQIRESNIRMKNSLISKFLVTTKE